MSKSNETSVKSVKVITDARETEIRGVFRTLHHLVLQSLTECEIAPLFPTEFPKCGMEDYKLLHQQSRALINSKASAAWNAYISDIKSKIEGVILTHMNLAREDKAEWDALSDRAKSRSPWSNVVKVPVSDLLPCFAEGKPLAQIVSELDKLFSGKVAKGKDDAFYLSVGFSPAKVEAPKAAEAPTSEPTPADAPTSTDVTASAA